jgi:CrcB protein
MNEPPRVAQNSAGTSLPDKVVAVRDLAVIAVAGAFGSLSRYGTTLWAQRRWGDTFPYGTLIVNIAGSFLLGLVLGMALAGKLPKLAKLGVGTGFLGAFTTFSTFSVDTMLLLKAGKLASAAGNIALNLAIGLAAAGLGFWLATKSPD